jgi:hypothetical protein
MQKHFFNLIATHIAIITRTECAPKKGIHSFDRQHKKIEKKPGIHDYIISRSTMSEDDFVEHLNKFYVFSFIFKFESEDSDFFDYYKKPGLIEELSLMQKMYANQEIELEIKLSEIARFLISDLDCSTHFKKLLLYLQILSSKFFSFNRKSVGKKWSHNKEKNVSLHNYLKLYEHEIKIQSFFFKLLVDLINSQPNFKQKIECFCQNESRMWDGIYVGFNLISKLFLYRDIPASIVCVNTQKQICESTLTLCYAFAKNWFEEYKIFKTFYPMQNIPPKFRRFLISRSNFGLMLVWRLFNRDNLNKLKKIPNSFISKIGMSIGFLPMISQFAPRYVKHFLCIH